MYKFHKSCYNNVIYLFHVYLLIDFYAEALQCSKTILVKKRGYFASSVEGC